MANLRTSSDIIFNALFNSNEQQNSSSDYYSQVIVYLNRAYTSLCSGGTELDPSVDEDWWWLRSPQPGTLTLLPSFNTATVSVTNGSKIFSYSSIPTDPQGNQASMKGRFLTVTGDNGDIYRIAGHTAGAVSGALDSPYTGVTNAAGAQRSFPLQYTLASNVKSIIGRMRSSQGGQSEIDYSDVDPMRTQFPLGTIPVGIPVLYAMVQEQVVEFSHYPGDLTTDQVRIEYDYLILPTDLVDDSGATAPIVPYEYNSILSDWTAGMVLTDKDDSRNGTYFSAAKQRLKAMAQEHRRRIAKTGNLTGKIMPRQSDVSRRSGPLRTQSGLIIG